MSWQTQNEQWKAAENAAASSDTRAKLSSFFDAGTFVEIDRLSVAGVLAGYGQVDGAPVYAYMQDKTVCAGAVGTAEAAKIVKVYELAAQNGAPIVAFLDSDGVKLNEGIAAMDAVAAILMHANNLSGVVPQIAVVLGACVGSAALIAANADAVIAVDGAGYHLGVGDEDALPAIKVADSGEAMQKAAEMLSYLPGNNLEPLPMFECDPAKITAADIDGAVEAVADSGSVLPLYIKHDHYAVAFGRIGGTPCGLVKLGGDSVCNCRSARIARFVRWCDAFSLPVVTFVDAAAFASLEGAAKVSHAYAEATCAKVTVIVGRAYGPVYIAVAGKTAGADAVLAWPEATISSLAPETAIHLVWNDRMQSMDNPEKDREALASEYAATECSAAKAAAAGYVTDVTAPEDTAAKVADLLEMLAGKRVSRLPKKHSDILL